MADPMWAERVLTAAMLDSRPAIRMTAASILGFLALGRLRMPQRVGQVEAQRFQVGLLAPAHPLLVCCLIIANGNRKTALLLQSSEKLRCAVFLILPLLISKRTGEPQRPRTHA